MHSAQDCVADALSRRDFLHLTLLSCALLLDPAAATLAAVEASSPEYGALRELAPGAVRPEGWLLAHLGKQAQLCSSLASLSWPFTEKYWAGLEDADAWWPWEQVAYWIDGATRLALVLVLQDPGLMAQVKSRIDYTLRQAPTRENSKPVPTSNVLKATRLGKVPLSGCPPMNSTRACSTRVRQSPVPCDL